MRPFAVTTIVLALALTSGAQTLLTSSATFYPGNGSSDRSVVRGPTGLLHALAVTDDTFTGNRPLILLTSADGGTTWTPSPAPLNDATSGISAPFATNWCAMAIDSLGLLHCTWGSYYYSNTASLNSYRQFYSSYDPISSTQSAIVSVNALVGAATSTRIAAQEIVVDQNDIVWMVSSGTSGSWREHLLRSTLPQAAGQTFTNLGPISSSASAQMTRLAVDSSGLIHAGYYRNLGQGEYYHRIYDPVNSSWNLEFRLGNTAVGQDNYGQFAADNLGNVHAIYVMDSSGTASWGYRYRRYDAVSGWSAETIVDDIPGANFVGIANYRIMSLACDEATGMAHLVFRDLNNGGSLMYLTKDLAAATFTQQAQIGPATTALHAYIYPAIRGSLFPAFNNTGSDVSLTYAQRVDNMGVLSHDWYFLSLTPTIPGPTLTLNSPLTLGNVSTLDVNSPNDPNLGYICGFAGSTTPASPMPGGGTLNLAFDFLLQFSIAPNNGVFFNNIGFLSPTGTASVAIAVPNLPALSNLTIYGAFVVEDPITPGLIGTISASLPMLIQ